MRCAIHKEIEHDQKATRRDAEVARRVELHVLALVENVLWGMSLGACHSFSSDRRGGEVFQEMTSRATQARVTQLDIATRETTSGFIATVYLMEGPETSRRHFLTVDLFFNKNGYLERVEDSTK